MYLFSRHAVVLRSCGSLYMKSDIESSSDLFGKHKTRADLFCIANGYVFIDICSCQEVLLGSTNCSLDISAHGVMFFTVHMETV